MIGLSRFPKWRLICLVLAIFPTSLLLSGFGKVVAEEKGFPQKITHTDEKLDKIMDKLERLEQRVRSLEHSNQPLPVAQGKGSPLSFSEVIGSLWKSLGLPTIEINNYSTPDSSIRVKGWIDESGNLRQTEYKVPPPHETYPK